MITESTSQSIFLNIWSAEIICSFHNFMSFWEESNINPLRKNVNSMFKFNPMKKANVKKSSKNDQDSS